MKFIIILKLHAMILFLSQQYRSKFLRKRTWKIILKTVKQHIFITIEFRIERFDWSTSNSKYWTGFVRMDLLFVIRFLSQRTWLGKLQSWNYLYWAYSECGTVPIPLNNGVIWCASIKAGNITRGTVKHSLCQVTLTYFFLCFQTQNDERDTTTSSSSPL